LNILTSPNRAYGTGPLYFQGLKTTRKAEKKLLPHEKLKRKLRREGDPYLGRLPETLPQTWKVGSKEALQQLDLWADQLRGLTPSYGTPLPNVLKVQQCGLQKANTQLHFIDFGTYGHVYALRIGRQTFAFKVFNPDHLYRKDPYEEAAIGQYFTAQKTRDLSRFYIANPAKGWMLMEFIGPDTRLAGRPGKSIEEHGYRFGDDGGGNRINGIRVDYGYLLSLKLHQRRILDFLITRSFR
jgi:hypothetical protein